MQCPHCHKSFDTKEAKMRSLPQLKYYWSVIVELISNHLGYTKDETHEILKTMFLSEVRFIPEKDGVKQIRVAASTGEKSTSEIEKYYSDIRQWASLELNIYIPEPNETTP